MIIIYLKALKPKIWALISFDKLESSSIPGKLRISFRFWNKRKLISICEIKYYICMKYQNKNQAYFC